jgi:hypothetical protein
MNTIGAATFIPLTGKARGIKRILQMFVTGVANAPRFAYGT